MTETTRLPIFPLQRVLLPGAGLVLHVFEPRYRAMLDQLDDAAGFGVALIRSGVEVGGGAEYHDVGTLVRILDRRVLDDGRVLLALQGLRRFSVIERLPEAPYPEAVVIMLDDDVRGLTSLAEEAAQLLRRYLAASAESGRGGDVTFVPSSNPAVVSFQVASLVRLTSPERQDLLELALEERLRREVSLLRRETELLIRLMGKGH